ncbi:MAG TPA: flagellar basal-body rod protein FlgF [Bacillales bacterium]|nr:flagellar basal-body rod protein FlgF [Bacillales bacterium]
MLRSMYAGISGMKNFQTKLDVIANNIANVNTYGYKKSRVTFQDLVSQQIAGASSPRADRGGTNPQQVGLGSMIGSIDTIHTPGSIQPTGRPLDLAISGDGFFIVNEGNAQFYTRAGNFYIDRQGNLVTANGLKVQGYGVNAQGQIDDSGLIDLQIDSGAFMPPTPTTQAAISGNINSGLQQGGTAQLKLTVIDSLGNEQPLTLTLTKSANPNEWSYTFTSSSGGTVGGTSSGTLTFDNQGNLVSPQQVNISLTNLPSGAADMNGMAFDLSQITQISSGNTLELAERNGNLEGYLESFSIGSSGEITGVYSNGEVNLLGQIALATFSNAGGLTKEGSNLFRESNNSGFANIGVAGDGRGTLTGSALEMSNVDLATAFTEMIVAQRGFQANTRIITTSDQILQELVNLKR